MDIGIRPVAQFGRAPGNEPGGLGFSRQLSGSQVVNGNALRMETQAGL